MESDLVGFHGFLGLPNDWGFWPEVKAAPLYPYAHLGLEPASQEISSDFDLGKKVVLGYSMGGRLAIHCLTHCQPRALVLVSTHPGLKNDQERQMRLQADKIWSEKFLTDDWKSLLDSWNQQGVFRGHSSQREETDFSRQALSQIMFNWSLGHQRDRRETVETSPVPILFVCGEQDGKFLGLQSELKGCDKSVIPDCGHRVLAEKPEILREEVISWLSRVL